METWCVLSSKWTSFTLFFFMCVCTIVSHDFGALFVIRNNNLFNLIYFSFLGMSSWVRKGEQKISLGSLLLSTRMQKGTDAADSCSNFFFFFLSSFKKRSSFPAFLPTWKVPWRMGMNMRLWRSERERLVFSLYFFLQTFLFSLLNDENVLGFLHTKHEEVIQLLCRMIHSLTNLVLFVRIDSFPYSFKIDDNSTVRRNVWIQSVIQTDNWKGIGMEGVKILLFLTLL